MITTKIPERSAAECVERCRRQQAAWSALPISQRLVLVRKFRNLLADECDMLCAAVEQDINKPAEETIAGDILPLAAACRFLEQRARGILRAQKVSVSSRPLWLFGQRDVVHRRPRGVVGIIGTWNYPLYLNGVQIMQAVVAGNAVLWKPSEVAPSSARALYSLVQRAGFPDGLIEMLPATREAGQELADAAIAHVVFTGSSTTGRALAANLGRRLVSSTLELSGCDSMFVLKDADVSLAAQAAWFGATLNKGQTCLATRRVFVDRGCAPAFVEVVNQYAAKAQPMFLALKGQVRQAERLVTEAAADGARVLRGSAKASTENAELACQPTVIADARPEMAICQEAIFAPVVAVIPFDSESDALKMDARCPYGLGASIFSTDVRRASDFAAHLRTGSVAINDVIVPTAHPETPFGGVGDSGWGVTQGVEGLLDMTVPQTVSIRSGTSRPHYGAACGAPAFTSQMLRGLLQWSHSATFFRRLSGLRQLIRGWRSKS